VIEDYALVNEAVDRQVLLHEAEGLLDEGRETRNDEGELRR